MYEYRISQLYLSFEQVLQNENHRNSVPRTSVGISLISQRNRTKDFK